nr:MAG TPA: hypothetical protein [Caudoviricetes sp.]
MKLTDAERLFSAIEGKEDNIAKAKARAAGSWETYYEGVADGLLLAKGMIAEEGTIEIYQNEIYQNKPEIDPVHAAGGVYCRECIYFVPEQVHKNDGTVRDCKPGELFVPSSEGMVFGSHCGRFDSVIVHGYRHGEPSVDKTLALTRTDDFCSRGKKREAEDDE